MIPGADVAICRNRQEVAKGCSALGYVLPVLADCHASLTMTAFCNAEICQIIHNMSVLVILIFPGYICITLKPNGI
jgi:hypothetical protein